jgi:hypothetical protein
MAQSARRSPSRENSTFTLQGPVSPDSVFRFFLCVLRGSISGFGACFPVDNRLGLCYTNSARDETLNGLEKFEVTIVVIAEVLSLCKALSFPCILTGYAERANSTFPLA